MSDINIFISLGIMFLTLIYSNKTKRKYDDILLSIVILCAILFIMNIIFNAFIYRGLNFALGIILIFIFLVLITWLIIKIEARFELRKYLEMLSEVRKVDLQN